MGKGSLAAALAVMAGLLAACGPGPSTKAPSGGPSTAPPAAHGDFRCPSLPYGPASRGNADGSRSLPPPASRDVHAGRFVTALRLDRALDVEPPRNSDEPAYDGDDALCAILASRLDNNASLGRQTRHTIAFGLARVTVPDAMLSGRSTLEGNGVGTVDGLRDVNAKRPAPSPYHDRLAWVAVVAPVFVSSCPAMLQGHSPPPDHSEPGHHGYQVFIVDAQTGGDALLYTERHNGICPGARADGPFLNVPMTNLSLPWTLDSVAADRSSAQVTFEVTPCDGYMAVVFAEVRHGTARVRVVVERPFGPPCGDSKQVTEKMRVSTVGVALPKRIVHAPVGPYAG